MSSGNFNVPYSMFRVPNQRIVPALARSFMRASMAGPIPVSYDFRSMNRRDIETLQLKAFMPRQVKLARSYYRGV